MEILFVPSEFEAQLCESAHSAPLLISAALQFEGRVKASCKQPCVNRLQEEDALLLFLLRNLCSLPPYLSELPSLYLPSCHPRRVSAHLILTNTEKL